MRRNSISKAIVAGLTALSLSASMIATADPAAAQWRGPGGGWHSGWGGWHGGWGGWHGGYRPGFGYWHPGYWNGGVWYPGWWAAAAAAGIATGVVVGTATSCWQSRPTYSPTGVYLGYQMVNVC